MAILDHRHEWASATTGYKCLQCDARMADLEVGTAGGAADLQKTWKKNH